VNGETPTTSTSFPISNDATAYKADKVRKIRGVTPAAEKAIDAINPYKGGNDLLWQLHKLNNVDKHRTLVIAGSAYKSFDITSIIKRDWASRGMELPVDFALPGLLVEDRMFPLKVGDKVFADLPDAEPNYEMKFTADVALGVPDVIWGDPLMKTMKEMGELVFNLIASFKPLL
jgi:hypothetical protein